MDKQFFVVEEKFDRLDLFLTENLEDLTRSAIKKLIDGNKVLVNERPCKAGLSLYIGDRIQVELPEPVKLDLTPEDIPLDIIYQDEDFAIINKQQGLTVHAGAGNMSGTLVNALLFHLDKLSGINGVIRPGIVHRIDKDTSGLLVVAKNDKAHLSLSSQIATKTCFRKYLALCEGIFKEDSGKIETNIGRSPSDRVKMAVVKEGKHAITHYKVLQRFEKGYTLVEFKLETGRTHQIRVHSRYIGHAIVGDKVYNPKPDKFGLNGQLLHAYELELNHPTTNERLTFNAPLPKYFEDVLDKIK